jgi:hypothetical protein
VKKIKITHCRLIRFTPPEREPNPNVEMEEFINRYVPIRNLGRVNPNNPVYLDQYWELHTEMLNHYRELGRIVPVPFN